MYQAIVFLPLIGCVIAGLFGRAIGPRPSELVTTTLLVTADNLVQLFFGWEGVGLASYLLIGFWYHKPEANAAAIKAFIVNRIGDFGFALGIFAVFMMVGALDFGTIFAQAPGLVGKTIQFLGYRMDALTLICVLLFIGAMGKSAHVLLHIWLPEAVDG